MANEKDQTNEVLKDVATVNKADEKAKQEVTSEEFFEEKAQAARETGEDQVIDLTTKVKVEFLKDIGFMKKGDKQEISQSAYDTYNMGKDKIVKEIR